ncbi:tRNA lysidine(34) synthetase TilS [Pelomonas sp. KK5]|uniref:tRNA lysidine(34) synthetase TilS n=1 Tax=Pelomonas sp. KK5 TaxID=1855730 RepID=UPI00097C7D63|nr:tRNA lysidine(34) synthetase TilS [Pelomonas sp. KK5]
MAGSATPRTADPRRVAVAFSGGRDSTALLQATVRSAPEASIDEVLAFHIHHGLSAHADAWQAHCERQCEALGTTLVTHYLSGKPAKGESVEAWAREGRHAALAAMCREHGVDLLLLAHHRRDQAETLLLQGLRGAGVAGLAGMPQLQWRDGICWARPWLRQPREAIEAYVAEQGLSHVEDDSNGDRRFARNQLRLDVWPSLNAAFPQAEASLAQAAEWSREALELQREMAAFDLQSLAGAGGLDLAGLAALSDARATNALRAWLHAQTGQPAPASLIRRLRTELRPNASWPCVGGQLHEYRGRLVFAATAAAPHPPSQLVNLGFAGRHPQPGWNGTWLVEPTEGEGVGVTRLQDLTLRAREGGETFQRSPKSAARSLKKACQEAGVPAWLRDGPLLFSGGQLVFAAGLGIDARMLAAADEPRMSLRWLPVESKAPFTAP